MYNVSSLHHVDSKVRIRLKENNTMSPFGGTEVSLIVIVTDLVNPFVSDITPQIYVYNLKYMCTLMLS